MQFVHYVMFSRQFNWCKYDFQVELPAPAMIVGVLTQGRMRYPKWVTRYNVSLSSDGSNWTQAKSETGGDEVKHYIVYNIYILYIGEPFVSVFIHTI
jgi:hypothetical protein